MARCFKANLFNFNAIIVSPIFVDIPAGTEQFFVIAGDPSDLEK
jgi:hypothetical protein